MNCQKLFVCIILIFICTSSIGTLKGTQNTLQSQTEIVLPLIFIYCMYIPQNVAGCHKHIHPPETNSFEGGFSLGLQCRGKELKYPSCTLWSLYRSSFLGYYCTKQKKNRSPNTLNSLCSLALRCLTIVFCTIRFGSPHRCCPLKFSIGADEGVQLVRFYLFPSSVIGLIFLGW